MTGKQRRISKGFQAVALLSLIVGAFILVRGATPFQQIATATRTLLTVASDNSNDLLGLSVICAGAAVFVMSDRRRRARGRQASS